MRKQAILIVLIILSSLSISAKDIVVINSENGKPLVGMLVFLEGNPNFTDRFGKINIAESETIEFVTYNNIHLNSELIDDTLIVDFPFTLDSPKKLGRIEGKVTNELNEELSYKRIELTKDGFKYLSRSDSSGDYYFDYLSAGDWDIIVDKSQDYKLYNKDIELKPNEKRVLNHQILLENKQSPFGFIAGEVHDEYGNPVIGASVAVIGTTQGAIVKANGKYVIPGLVEGEYELKVSSIGYTPIAKKVLVSKNKTSEANFELPFDTTLVLGDIEVNSTKLVDKNQVGSSTTISANDIQHRASSASGGVTSLVALSSGATSSGKGYSVRGTVSNSALLASGDLIGEYPSYSDSEGDFSVDIDWTNTETEAGQLTSGEVNDFRKWEMWSDIAKDELSGYIDDWGIEPTNRYTVQLTSLDNRPVIDAKVNLINQVGKIIWSARSDNTGKAELWADAYSEIDDDTSGLAVEVFYKGKRKYEQNISSFKDGINFIQIDEYCSQPNKIDILFAMDATASMGDELEYLKAELLDIIDRLESANSGVNLRVGSLFYRDFSSPLNELLSTHDLTTDIFTVNDFINQQEAKAGGDIPEAVDVALSSAVNEFTWSEDAIARIMFLILDAPPHSDAATMKRFKELTAKAAEMGIRIIPLVASGINKSDEYLMRSVALLTNGTYLFLTDDSGIGNSHIKPTTDSYDVEMMNEMIVRIINQFIDVPKCGSDEIEYANKIEDKIYNKQENINQDISEFIWVYPNPTDGPLTLSLQEEYDNLFVVDMNGKILFKVEAAQGDIQVNLSNFPSGAYFLKYSKDGAWGSTQLQLIR